MSETENGHKASISLIWKHILGGTVLPFWGQYYSDFKTRWRRKKKGKIKPIGQYLLWIEI